MHDATPGRVMVLRPHLNQEDDLSGGLICGDGVERLLLLPHLDLDAHPRRQAQQLLLVLQAEPAEHADMFRQPVSKGVSLAGGLGFHLSPYYAHCSRLIGTNLQ